jgi:hypothetical protein
LTLLLAEAMGKVCGVLMAMPQGQSGSFFVERITVNTGTVRILPVVALPAWVAGWAHRPPIGPERGGAAVVVRCRESR